MKNILLKSALTLLLTLVTVMGWGQALQMTSILPADNSSVSVLTPPIKISFNYSIRWSAVSGTRYIKVVEAGGAVALSISVTGNSVLPAGAAIITNNSSTDGYITITSPTLTYGKNYYILIDPDLIRRTTSASYTFSGITDPTGWNFSVIDPTQPPIVNSVMPYYGDVDVELTPLFLGVEFDREIVLNSGTIQLYKTDGSLIKIYDENSIEVGVYGKSLEIYDESITLENYTNYYVLISSGFLSSSYGVAYPGISDPTTWTFRTVAAPLTSAPNNRDPLDNATDVAIDKALSITFSEPIDFTLNGLITIKDLTTGKTFAIYDADSPELSISGATLSINPTANFTNSTEYQVTIDAGFVASSVTGATNSEITAGTWTFTIAAPPSPITTLTPANALTNISIDTDIKINFDQPVRFADNTLISASNISNLIASITGSDGHSLTAADYLTEVNATNDTITLTLKSQLHENVAYTVVVNPVENFTDNLQGSTYSSTFRTASAAKWLGLSSAWNSAGNWSTGAIPDNTMSVIIQKAGGFDPVIAAGTSPAPAVNSMTINADASLTINGSLNILNGLTLKSSASQNASLLNNGTLTVSSSKVKIQQVVTNPAWDYYISSPVSGATPAKIGFVGTVYERLVNSWGAVGSNTTLTNAKGYVGIPTSATTLVYKGTINNGSYTFTGQRTTTPNNYGWSLAGNPYPCSIDWTSSSLTKTNLTNGFWVYLNDTQRWGTYGGNAGLGVNVDPLAPSLIPSGHAFYVQVLQGQTTGTLNIAPGSRVNNTGSYLKAAQAPAANPVLRFEGVNGSLTDELAVTFIDGATDAFDVYDSQKQTSSNPDLLQVFSLAGTTRCAINSFYPNDFANSVTISLGYTAAASGTYNLRLKSLNGFADNIVASLEDTQKGLIQEISSGDSYAFSTTAKTDLTRFKIHLSAKVSTDVDADKVGANNVITYVSDRILYVKVSGSGNMTYELIDTNGQVVNGGDLTPDTYNRIVSSKNGVFILKVISNQGVYCKKVLIN